MNSFFNDTTSDIVQLIALPIEVLGFTLASIEIYFPTFADRIEKFIDTAEIWLKEKAFGLLEGLGYVLIGALICALGFTRSFSETWFYEWALGENSFLEMI